MRRYLFLAIAFIVISGGITYSILIWDKPLSDLSDSDEGVQKTKTGEFSELVTQTPPELEKIEIDLSENRTLKQIIFKRVYTFCNHTVTEELVSDSPLLNLSREELIGLYPGWTIENQMGGHMVLSITINDLCPTDLRKRYVGEKGGYVTVFYGQPGMKKKVVKITDIPVDGFPPLLQKKLSEGIITETEDQLISLIDGLASYYWE